MGPINSNITVEKKKKTLESYKLLFARPTWDSQIVIWDLQTVIQKNAKS